MECTPKGRKKKKVKIQNKTLTRVSNVSTRARPKSRRILGGNRIFADSMLSMLSLSPRDFIHAMVVARGKSCLERRRERKRERELLKFTLKSRIFGRIFSSVTVAARETEISDMPRKFYTSIQNAECVDIARSTPSFFLTLFGQRMGKFD